MKLLEKLFVKLFGHYPRWYVRLMNYNTGFKVYYTLEILVNEHNKKEAKNYVIEEILPILERKLKDIDYPIRIIKKQTPKE